MRSLINQILILSVLFALILVNAVLSADKQPELGPPPGKYKMLTDNGRAEIPFTIYQGDIHFSAEINGHKVHMLLDDGYMWDQLLFWGSPKVDSFGFIYDGEVGVGGGSESDDALMSKTASGITVTLPGGVEFSEQTAIITPYSSGNSVMWSGSVGQFSASFFKHFIVDINFDKMILTLIERDKFEYSGSGSEIPWKQSEFGIWIIPAKMNLADGREISLDFAMDLGYNTQLEVKTYGENTIPVPKQALPKTFGRNIIGETTSGFLGRMPQIEIGGYKINDAIVDYVDSKPGKQKTYECMVGLGLLSKFNLIFDFYGQRLIVEPNNSFAELYEYNMSGLVMSKEENNYYTVHKVHKNSPASETGLKEGDKISQINGKDASEYNRIELKTLFLQEGKTIKLRLLQNSAEKEVSIKLRRII
ncbi:MAG: PDZ domain-containing protein [candidate division Zixibacteria bacterium]|nr:PDZ domain-containing protein [candidate division Zixibacteria bacterium]